MKKYDPMLTMSALNMAIVSLHRITSTGDRVVLDREYDNIINNLRMGEINDDPELTELYQEIVRVINRGRLRDEVKSRIKTESSGRKRKTFRYFISGNVLKNFSTSPARWVSKVALSSVSEYFSRILNENEILRLNDEEMTQYDELQRKLLASSWQLLRKYNLKDSCRITQNGLKNLSSAMNESDSSKRVRMLKYLEDEFSAYAPYWFYRSEASRLSGDEKGAGEYFHKFCEVWRPVLRKDPYVVEAMKLRIKDLCLVEGEYKNAVEILRCIALMKANIQFDDWASNIFAGMMYFSLGYKDEAEECVMCNIDFGFESEVSGRLLARMELDGLPKRVNALPDEGMNVTDVPRTESASGESHEELFRQGKAYIQKGSRAEKYCILFVIGAWLVFGYFGFSYMMTGSFLLNIFILAIVIFSVLIGMVLSFEKLKGYLTGYTSKYYKLGRELYIRAAENGNINAMYSLGKWCADEKKEDEAISWYRKAAYHGHRGAQRLLSAIYSSRNDNYEAYKWAYLVCLCYENTNDENQPDHENYSLYGLELMSAEAEAQKIYDNIQQRGQNV